MSLGPVPQRPPLDFLTGCLSWHYVIPGQRCEYSSVDKSSRKNINLTHITIQILIIYRRAFGAPDMGPKLKIQKSNTIRSIFQVQYFLQYLGCSYMEILVVSVIPYLSKQGVHSRYFSVFASRLSKECAVGTLASLGQLLGQFHSFAEEQLRIRP